MASILVVDDSPIDRRLIGALLAKEDDWQILFADDGQEAINEIERSAFDLVVTDLQMPNVDGLGLVKAIREHDPLLPILLVTSKGSQDIAVEALKTGATNYSPKSKLARDLLGTAKHVIEFAKTLRESTENWQGTQQKNSFNFVLENDSELVGPIIATLESNLPEWSETERLRIGMAINEAIANAIYHGNLEVASELKEDDENQFYELVEKRKNEAPYSDRRVRVEAKYTADEIKVTVCDQGPGFDPNRVADPTCTENLERLSGRGLLLIRSFMDEVTHNSTGNQISMVKKCPSD